jgi:hypothetical protein
MMAMIWILLLYYANTGAGSGVRVKPTVKGLPQGTKKAEPNE